MFIVAFPVSYSKAIGPRSPLPTTLAVTGPVLGAATYKVSWPLAFAGSWITCVAVERRESNATGELRPSLTVGGVYKSLTFFCNSRVMDSL